MFRFREKFISTQNKMVSESFVMLAPDFLIIIPLLNRKTVYKEERNKIFMVEGVCIMDQWGMGTPA